MQCSSMQGLCARLTTGVHLPSLSLSPPLSLYIYIYAVQ